MPKNVKNNNNDYENIYIYKINKISGKPISI